VVAPGDRAQQFLDGLLGRGIAEPTPGEQQFRDRLYRLDRFVVFVVDGRVAFRSFSGSVVAALAHGGVLQPRAAQEEVPTAKIQHGMRAHTFYVSTHNSAILCLLTRQQQTLKRARDNKARILVADHRFDMREYLARLLSTKYEVICASNGNRFSFSFILLIINYQFVVEKASRH
jgi:hypothetical protein